MKKKHQPIWTYKTAMAVFVCLTSTHCTTMKSVLGVDPSDSRSTPISNPFNDFQADAPSSKENIILRTKKGDRSVEVEIPGDTAAMTDFTMPVSPAFREDGRSPASVSDGDGGLDDRYKDKHAGISDREITHAFPQGPAENSQMRTEVESTLGVQASEDSTPNGDQSYLAAVDHVKQLFRNLRYEAALIETDDLLRRYPTDPKLHSMRGTLLDRVGQHDLALRSWNQALRLDPSNVALKKFVERKQQARGLASP